MNDSLDSLSWMVNRVQLYFLSVKHLFLKKLENVHDSLLHAKSFNETSKVYSTGGLEYWKTKLKGKVLKQVYSVPVMKREKKKNTFGMTTWK